MKLFRCRWDRKIAGVCGGLGHYLKIDPTLVRIAFLILLFPTFGIMLLLYLLAWWLIPEGPKAYVAPKCKKLYRSKKNRMIGGVCAGFAEYFGIDANIIRLATVVIGIFTGFFPAIIVYILALFVVPEKRLQK
ncbi:MAG: PspC domain-containing protein [Candidatus Algichlamydia australiensis]|nr:PspC domain-containing protein [Chlamydiales bacterium]